jgi:WD40 repeat protein
MLHGASNGELQVWSKGSFLKGFKDKARPHTSCLDAIAVVQDKYILTGGKDHTICVMDTSFKVLQKINTYTLFPKCFNGNVRALTYKAKGNKLCVGLFSSEIYECTLTVIAQGKMEVQNVLSGHYSNSTVWTNEVWGLERYQRNTDLYLTCSMDGTFREWSISKKTQTRAIRLDIDEKGSVLPLRTDPKGKNDLQDMGKLMCIGIDMEDKFAAVGCKDGTVRFVDLTGPELRQTKVIKLSKQWISDIKWSPQNDKLAIGSHDNAIYILTWPELTIPRRSKMQKHSSFITHLDWSSDGSFLHSTCGAYELLFWDANSYKQMTSGATALRDEPWHTWSTTLGWPVQEIFRDNWDGSDVNMVFRSDNKFGSSPSNKYPLLATGDDEGKVRVYRWPVLRKNAGVVCGDGHSSHVTNVRFMDNDNWAISTGGEDQCVFQWRVIGSGDKVKYLSN